MVLALEFLGEGRPAHQEAAPEIQSSRNEVQAPEETTAKKTFLKKGHGRLAAQHRGRPHVQEQDVLGTGRAQLQLQKAKSKSRRIERKASRQGGGQGGQSSGNKPPTEFAEVGGRHNIKAEGTSRLAPADMPPLSKAGERKVELALEEDTLWGAAPTAYVGSKKALFNNAELLALKTLPGGQGEHEAATGISQADGPSGLARVPIQSTDGNPLKTAAALVQPRAKAKPGWDDRFWISRMSSTSATVAGIGGQWIQLSGSHGQQDRGEQATKLPGSRGVANRRQVSRMQKRALAVALARRDYERRGQHEQSLDGEELLQENPDSEPVMT
jgi:hypothetical protein